jgi:opacity protein-like surface antigen
MTDDPGVSARTARGGTLGLRLALAFLMVALAAVALLAGLTAAFAAADVSHLANQQRTELTAGFAVAAGAVWGQDNTWDSSDLSSVLDNAARTGAAVQIRDQAGHAVASSADFTAAKGPQSSHPIVVRNQ